MPPNWMVLYAIKCLLSKFNFMMLLACWLGCASDRNKYYLNISLNCIWLFVASPVVLRYLSHSFVHLNTLTLTQQSAHWKCLPFDCCSKAFNVYLTALLVPSPNAIFSAHCVHVLSSWETKNWLRCIPKLCYFLIK